MEDAHVVSTFGKYRLIASLARGGMARVYLALMAGPADFHKLLVLKVMRNGVLGDSADAVRMFMNEARLAARIVHANVVHTFEVGEIDDRPFLAMEYVEGQTYRTLQTRAGTQGLPLHEELRILAELSRGLSCLHELEGFDGEPLRAVHRDVSPQNVLIGYDGQVKLLDFGIAKTADPSHWTQAGVIKGKIDYIAPEQLRGEQVDRRADVFALGVMLWEAVAGKRFAGGATVSEAAKAQARLSGAEPNIRSASRDVPEALALLLDRALALDPAARLPDAASFAEALDAYLLSAAARPTARSLASLMSSLFADDREKLRRLVEKQIDAVRLSGPDAIPSDATGALPRFELPSTRTQSAFWSLGAQGRTDHPPAALHSHHPAPERRSKVRARSWAVMLISALTAGAAAWFTPSAPASEHGRPAESMSPSEPSAPSTAALASTPSAAAATLPASGGGEPPIPSSVAPADVSSRLEPVEVTVKLALSVLPPNARVTLDGVAISLPFEGELPRDSALHDLRATAPGFLPFRQRVGFDRDRTIEIALQRAPVRKAGAASVPLVKAPAGPGGLPILLGIDTTDPYIKRRTK